MSCFPTPDGEGGFVKDLYFVKKKISNFSLGSTPHFYPTTFRLAKESGDHQHVVGWSLVGHIRDHPTHAYSLLPARHTSRGRQVTKQVWSDLEGMVYGRPIGYLGLYARNLLTTHTV